MQARVADGFSLHPCSVFKAQALFGPVVQSVSTPACHAGGRRFESVPGRQIKNAIHSDGVFLFGKQRNGLEPSKCDCPVDNRSSPARWGRQHNVTSPFRVASAGQTDPFRVASAGQTDPFRVVPVRTRKGVIFHQMTPFSYSIFSKPALRCCLHGFSFRQTLLYIQNPLVAASPEGDLQTFLGLNKPTVDQNVNG